MAERDTGPGTDASKVIDAVEGATANPLDSSLVPEAAAEPDGGTEPINFESAFDVEENPFEG
jgi:hypothetical protein